MDANYSAFLHDVLHPSTWRDVTHLVPEINEFWAWSGLADCQPAANPGLPEYTYFKVPQELYEDGTHQVGVVDLLPQCTSATRIDLVAVSHTLMAGVRSYVMPTSPIRTDHHPVCAEIPNIGIWAGTPQGPHHVKRAVPHLQDVTKLQHFQYFGKVNQALDGLLATSSNYTLEELNQSLVEALNTAATDHFRTDIVGGPPGHDKLFQLITAACHQALKLLHLAQQPDSKTDRVCSWSRRFTLFGKYFQRLWMSIQEVFKERKSPPPFSLDPLISLLAYTSEWCDAQVKANLSPKPLAASWAEIALCTTQFREATHA